MTKRILSVLLSVVMLVGLLPLSAFAASAITYGVIDRVEITVSAPQAGKSFPTTATVTCYDDAGARKYITSPLEDVSVAWYPVGSGTPMGKDDTAELGGVYDVTVMITAESGYEIVPATMSSANTINGEAAQVMRYGDTYWAFSSRVYAAAPMSDGPLGITITNIRGATSFKFDTYGYWLQWTPTQSGSHFEFEGKGKNTGNKLTFDGGTPSGASYEYKHIWDFDHAYGIGNADIEPPDLYTITVTEYSEDDKKLASDTLTVYITPVNLAPLTITTSYGQPFSGKFDYQVPAGTTCTFEITGEDFDWVTISPDGTISGTAPNEYTEEKVKVKMTCSNGYVDYNNLYLNVGNGDGYKVGQMYIAHAEVYEDEKYGCLRKPEMYKEWHDSTGWYQNDDDGGIVDLEGFTGGQGEEGEWDGVRRTVESHLYLNGANICCRDDLTPFQHNVVVPKQPALYTVRYSLWHSYDFEVADGATVTYKGKEYPLCKDGSDIYFEIPYGVYDVTPSVHSITVNGKTYEDGDVVNLGYEVGGTIDITGKLDYKLSKTMQNKGCTIDAKPLLYVNGRLANQSQKGYDGNAVTYGYSKTMASRDKIEIRYSIDVTWPDGTVDTVDTVNVDVHVDDGGMLNFTERTPNWLYTSTDRIVELGSAGMYFGESMQFKFVAKPLTAEQKAAGYTVEKRMRIEKDGYGDVYDSASGAGIDLKDYVDDAGEYHVYFHLSLYKNGTLEDYLTLVHRITVKTNTLSHVHVMVPDPIAGELPNNDLSAITYETEGYEVTDIDWTDLDGIILPEGETFKEGEKYLCILRVKPKAGYVFQNNVIFGTINNRPFTLSENYSTTKAYVELEMTPLTTPRIEKQPVGGEVISGQTWTAEWGLNFRPVKIQLHKRKDGSASATSTVLDPDLTSYDLSAYDSGYYYFRFYYTDNKYVTSNNVTVKTVDPAFITKPKGGVVDKNGELLVEWETNFTPVKVIISYHNAALEETYPETLDNPSAVGYDYLAPTANDGSYYWINAYYSDTEYITSGSFYVLANDGYTVRFGGPKGVVLHDGEYLMQGETAPSNEKTSDNYAYYENGVLYLHHFKTTDSYYIYYTIPHLEVRYTGDCEVSGFVDDNVANSSSTTVTTNSLYVWGNGTLKLRSGYSTFGVAGDLIIGQGTIDMDDGCAYAFEVNTLKLIDGAQVRCYCSQGGLYIKDTVEVIEGAIHVIDAGTWNPGLAFVSPDQVIGDSVIYAYDYDYETQRGDDYTTMEPWDGTRELDTYDGYWIVNEPIRFTEYPQDDYAIAGEKATVTWKTSKAPAKIELLTVDGNQHGTYTDIDPTATSLELDPLPDDGSYYWLIVYDAQGNKDNSGIFYIREVSPKFVTEPQSTDTIIGETATVTWEVNFKPVKYVLAQGTASGAMTPVEEFSGDITSLELPYYQRGYTIRAFYTNTAFVPSERFYLFNRAPYTEDSTFVCDGTMTVDVERLAEASENWMEAYFNETITYQWYRGDVAIDGETNQSYSPVAADIGCEVYAILSRTDSTSTMRTMAKTIEKGNAKFSFVRQPTLGAQWGDYEGVYYVDWETDFKPVKIEIYRRIEAMHSPTFSIFAIQDTDCQQVEDNIIQHTETWGEYSEYFVRAYYSEASTAFVDSEIIRVTMEAPTTPVTVIDLELYGYELAQPMNSFGIYTDTDGVTIGGYLVIDASNTVVNDTFAAANTPYVISVQLTPADGYNFTELSIVDCTLNGAAPVDYSADGNALWLSFALPVLEAVTIDNIVMFTEPYEIGDDFATLAVTDDTDGVSVAQAFVTDEKLNTLEGVFEYDTSYLFGVVFVVANGCEMTFTDMSLITLDGVSATALYDIGEGAYLAVFAMPEISSFLLGDVNLDGKVDLNDATTLFYHVNGLLTLSGDNLAAADVNEDGKVDLNDATRLFYIINGLIG